MYGRVRVYLHEGGGPFVLEPRCDPPQQVGGHERQLPYFEESMPEETFKVDEHAAAHREPLLWRGFSAEAPASV